MKRRHFQKFIFSLGVILSLMTSALAACACSHHAVAVKAEEHIPSCHQSSHQTTNQVENVEIETENESPSVSENCSCFVNNVQPVVVFKSENVKAQKILAVLPDQTKTEIGEFVFENETAKIHFEYHFYNSNYLKRLTPSRAPPIL